MSKVIIGIHGLGNKPKKEVLEKWWKAAIHEGLEKTRKSVPTFKFELVYWADILYEKPLNENCSNKKDPLCLHEKYISSPSAISIENHDFRRKVLDFLSEELDSIFLNEDFSLNYSLVTDTILHRWFKDLQTYYSSDLLPGKNSTVKDLIRKRTVDVLKKYMEEELLVIGHSMGSIIAYDVLSSEKNGIKIDSFLTLGSPLGIPVVKSRIATERKLNHHKIKHLNSPGSILRKWYNFADLEDKVAFHYKLSDDFGINRHLVKPIDFIVNNDYEINGEKNPHKSYGYLRAPEVTEKIIEFLEYEQPPKWKKIIRGFRNWKSYLKWISRTNRNPLNR